MSWDTKKLSEVCTFDKNQGEYSGIPYIGLENIESNTGKLVSNLAEITEVKSSTFKFNDSHLLYGRLRPYLNKVYSPNFTGHCSTEIFPIKPFENISRDYLKYWFIQSQTVNHINGTCTGARMPRANMNAVMNFSIPLPPLHIQTKIVGMLDTLFSEIDKAIEATEANSKNCEALFQSCLTEVFEGNGKHWQTHSIKSLGKVVTGNTPKTNEQENYGDYIPFVKPGDFNADGSIDFEKQKLSKVGMEKSRVINPKSTLMVCIGATIGKCGYTDIEVVTNQQINSITPTQNFNHKFIYYQMLTNEFQSNVLEGSGQATLPIINKSKWEALNLRFPLIDEQFKIVERFDSLRTETDILKTGFAKKIKELSLLKDSILQKAFSGELVKE